ncbi:MAG: hypothetical protein JWM68_2725 [Verrucomicrobiales bacterium]|nr:hypothetical protein [Verrucomicrobiales bacterium]
MVKYFNVRTGFLTIGGLFFSKTAFNCKSICNKSEFFLVLVQTQAIEAHTFPDALGISGIQRAGYTMPHWSIFQKTKNRVFYVNGIDLHSIFRKTTFIPVVK